ncbi:unnamed protein product [Clonostachys rosea f. rosea IK726]|uniref:Uncharacterized protein n=1 Tax=Clonostachys rosea f. rosea IK726 TaxID=1349383 RepID=A0ACA9TFE3_BIOOC|nr:unnamed protein product [Clonostachys rosea f. rosea IK726]
MLRLSFQSSYHHQLGKGAQNSTGINVSVTLNLAEELRSFIWQIQPYVCGICHFVDGAQVD